MTKSMKVETGMGQVLDSLTTYAVALLSIMFATIMANSAVILTVGGLVLMLLRLYVDGSKAWRTWKRNKDPLYLNDD